MAYTKHTWQCGESISADLLNHMEQGIEDASGGGTEPLIVTITEEYDEATEDWVFTSDKTVEEIIAALPNAYIYRQSGTHGAIYARISNVFDRQGDGSQFYVTCEYTGYNPMDSAVRAYVETYEFAPNSYAVYATASGTFFPDM